jgi:hypothetical protein
MSACGCSTQSCRSIFAIEDNRKHMLILSFTAFDPIAVVARSPVAAALGI